MKLVLVVVAMVLLAFVVGDAVATIKNPELGMSYMICEDSGRSLSNYIDLILLALNEADLQAEEQGFGQRCGQKFEYGKVRAFYGDNILVKEIKIDVSSLDYNETNYLVYASDDRVWADRVAKEYFAAGS